MKIVTILGARPQFIKAAAVSRSIRQHNKNSDNYIKEIIIHTGQHFDKNMSDDFFTELEIPQPDYNLKIANLSHGAMTGRMLEAIEAVLQGQWFRWESGGPDLYQTVFHFQTRILKIVSQSTERGEPGVSVSEPLLIHLDIPDIHPMPRASQISISVICEPYRTDVY